MTYDPRWGRFENMPTNLVGLSPTPMPTFSLIPQSMTKRIAGQLWRSASILELPKMTPKWPLTPNSWTPLLSPPPPPPDDHCIEILQKSIKAYSRRSILWFWTHRQIHACHKLSKFSLFPFVLPPPKFWCHHCYYLLINRKLYSLQKKHIFLTSPTHSIIILKSYQTTWTSWTWVFLVYLLCTTAFC